MTAVPVSIGARRDPDDGSSVEPHEGPLVDRHGRVHSDLRISITDRCNFRCAYCMPDEGMAWLPRDDLLSYEEIARVARVCVERFGFDAVRLTGGEPLVRAHVARLVALLAPLGVDLALTTNGVKLAELAHDLADAGLDRVNVSLDTLRPRALRRASRRRDELNGCSRASTPPRPPGSRR